MDLIWTAIKTGMVENENQVKIYPNPVRDNLNIELANNEIAQVTIFSLSGEVVLNTEITGSHRLSTTSIGSGLYLLLIKVGGFIKKTKIAIIQ